MQASKMVSATHMGDIELGDIGQSQCHNACVSLSITSIVTL